MGRQRTSARAGVARWPWPDLARSHVLSCVGRARPATWRGDLFMIRVRNVMPGLEIDTFLTPAFDLRRALPLDGPWAAGGRANGQGKVYFMSMTLTIHVPVPGPFLEAIPASSSS